MIRRTERTARRWRRCDVQNDYAGCARSIAPGDRYTELVLSPNDPDVGNVGWWRLAECAPCTAARMLPHELAAAME